MNKKLLPSALGIICGLLSGFTYYAIADYIFNSTIPGGVPYVSMFKVAIYSFVAMIIIYFGIFYALKRKYRVFAYWYIYSAIMLSIILLYIMSTIKYYFN